MTLRKRKARTLPADAYGGGPVTEDNDDVFAQMQADEDADSGANEEDTTFERLFDESANEPPSKTQKLLKSTSFIKKRRFLFPLGLILGSILAVLIVTEGPGAPLTIPAQLAVLLSQPEWQTDFTMVTQRISSAVPSFDWPNSWARLESEWDALKARIPEPWKLNNDGREFQVGERMRSEGRAATHPVVLIPGIISTVCPSYSTAKVQFH